MSEQTNSEDKSRYTAAENTEPGHQRGALTSLASHSRCVQIPHHLQHSSGKRSKWFDDILMTPEAHRYAAKKDGAYGLPSGFIG